MVHNNIDYIGLGPLTRVNIIVKLASSISVAPAVLEASVETENAEIDENIDRVRGPN